MNTSAGLSSIWKVIPGWIRYHCQTAVALHRNFALLYRRNKVLLNRSFMKINEQAPLQIKKQLYIQASIHEIWQFFMQINNWPDWIPGVTEARMDKKINAGAGFYWKQRDIVIRSEIAEIEPYQFFSWTDTVLGTKVIHNWCFYPFRSGTLVQAEQSIEGFLTYIYWKGFQRKLLEETHHWLLALQSQKEIGALKVG